MFTDIFQALADAFQQAMVEQPLFQFLAQTGMIEQQILDGHHSNGNSPFGDFSATGQGISDFTHFSDKEGVCNPKSLQLPIKKAGWERLLPQLLSVRDWL